MMDEAFVSGLLHDAGKIALAFNFPDEYTKVMAQTQTNSGDLICSRPSRKFSARITPTLPDTCWAYGVCPRPWSKPSPCIIIPT
jgi:hypothetical protein